MATIACYSSLSLFFLSLCLHNIVLTNAFNGGFGVELVHRKSPKSPFYGSINHVNKGSAPRNTPEISLGWDEYEYFLSYSIGTPPFQIFGFFDISADITWMQCKPCSPYEQTPPLFDPLKSSTYKTLPCSSTTCTSVPNTTCSLDYKHICNYFRDDYISRTQGDLSVDTFTLKSTSGNLMQFPRTVIGCGHDNLAAFGEEISGVVSFGRGPTSLVSQLDSLIGGKFSYCLAPAFSHPNSSSIIKFGNDAVVSGEGTVSTPIYQKDPKASYFVHIEAFSVGKERIELGNSTLGSSGDGNAIIGTQEVETYFPNDVYSKLASAVKRVVKSKRVRIRDKPSILCYDSGSKPPQVPIITLHFKGADIQLNALNTFAPVAKRIYCLAFTNICHKKPYAILGSLVQQNFLVGFDLPKNIVSFKPKDCAK
ncbi:aspartic proteinase CDR1-like [Abrus precatorius]|uniref:Aspartic proteinase CDR1-like n=1 Tax=Abrus precatorius TaxID=3816 RepID=A0A8B8LKR1_ABRPR|nr:aspartic proteinase CDR1-like [Abrus precatorius]